MIVLRTLAFVLVLLAGTAAQARDQVGVEIVQYGLFRSDIVGKQPGPGGVIHNVVDNICHIATTETVPMKIGVHFGLRYRVTGPVAGGRVLLRRVIHYPVVMTLPGGRPASLVSNFVELRAGTTSYAEYALEHDWELVPGIWTFQFFERDRKLAEFRFTVAEDAAVLEEINPTCFQLSS